MLPIRDAMRPFGARAPATAALILGNIVVFLYELLLPAPALTELVQEAGFIPARFWLWSELGGAPFDLERIRPLFSSMFLHGGWTHLLGNLLYLWVFGWRVESAIGAPKLLAFYATCGARGGDHSGDRDAWIADADDRRLPGGSPAPQPRRRLRLDANFC